MALAVLHGCFKSLVVSSRIALGNAGEAEFDDDLFDGAGSRFDRSGTGGIPDGTESDIELLNLLARQSEGVSRVGIKHALAIDNRAAMAEVQTGHFDVPRLDIAPDI